MIHRLLVVESKRIKCRRKVIAMTILGVLVMNQKNHMARPADYTLITANIYLCTGNSRKFQN